MDKHIFKKNAALTQEESNNCIKYFEEDKDPKEDKIRGYSLVFASLRYDEFKFLGHLLATNINEYVKQHSFLSNNVFPWTMEEWFNIQKYYPGNCYSGEHMEHGKDDHNCKKILGWMFYLNDIKEGGGTCWPQQNFITTPKRGDLFIWPAGWTHSHYGIAAPIEIKYILTGWCSFK